jgi:nitrite reductase/ring-hydroxylating ferredoxin subunit
MERKQFIKSCAFACLAGSVLVSALDGCTGARVASGGSIQGTISGSELLVPISAFASADGKFKKYVVVNHDQMQFPICVYRFSENEYTALLMKCTHQGAELQVFGDKLQCPAHGSEFSNRGVVENAPADTNLRTFPITINPNELSISLQ